MSDSVSPLVESSVRKRAGGRCEWETKGSRQFEDIQICGSDDFPRVLKVRRADFKLLCRHHYDSIMNSRVYKIFKNKPKSPSDKGQLGLFN